MIEKSHQNELKKMSVDETLKKKLKKKRKKPSKLG